MKRVFVAEDDAALSRGICMALQSDDLAPDPIWDDPGGAA